MKDPLNQVEMVIKCLNSTTQYHSLCLVTESCVLNEQNIRETPYTQQDFMAWKWLMRVVCCGNKWKIGNEIFYVIVS